MAYTYGDFLTFVLDNSDQVFRYWVFKRMFTPLECERKYFDQSQFEDSTASLGIIKECIELSNGDVILGFEPVFEYNSEPEEHDILYYKLSEIRLAKYERDQRGGTEHEEDR